MADPNLGQLAATTLRARNSEVADSVLNNNALLAWLKRKGKVVTHTGGGRTFVEPIFFSENSTTKFYDGGMESFSIPTESVIDASEWSRAFQAGFIYFTESERQANKGGSAAVDLIEAKIENLKSTLANDFSTALFADGTASNNPEGLQSIVADDPTTGTVGGINAATYAWWRNQYKTDTTATASNIWDLMTGQWLATIRPPNRPDLIVAGVDMFTYYADFLQANQRFSNTTDADVLGFESLKFQSATVLYDPTCADKRMYGLDTKDFKLKCDSGRKWATGSNRDVTNATYDVTPILWSGAILTCRRESHFVIEGT